MGQFRIPADCVILLAMENYRTNSHSRFDNKYHFVWFTKYRKSVLHDAIAYSLRDLVHEVCQAKEIEILQGHISYDHVHVFLSCPPTMSPSKIMQYLKGKTSRKLMMEYSDLRKQFWVVTYGHATILWRPAIM